MEKNQCPVLGPLLFLIYMHELRGGITSVCKIYAHNILLFSKAFDIKKSVNELNTALQKINE